MSDRKIKVLSVCTSDFSGGAARAAYRIHLSVQEFGIDSKMFVKHKGTDDVNVIPLSFFIPENSIYRAFDWIRNKVKNKWHHYVWRQYPKRSSYFLSDLRSTSIGGALQKIDYDILHLHWVNLRFLPLDKLPKDKPIVWTLHDSWPFCGICHSFLDCSNYKRSCGNCPFLQSGKGNDLSHQVWKKKLKLYKGLNLNIVTPSIWLADCVRESSLLGRYPVQVIPNGLDATIFQPLEGKGSKTERRFTLVYGAMGATTDKIKGVALLVESLRILHDRHQTDGLEVLIFGTNTPVEGIPSAIPVKYTGYLDTTEELVSIYNDADVVAVPSYTEVFGQVASEALACGTPVVAFRCTGIQEVVDGSCGYLAEPYDAEDFATGILWCLDNNADGSLSRNARNKVLSNYTQRIVGAKYAQLYENLCRH